MAATLLGRLGMKEAALFVCWKHSQVLAVGGTAAAQRCTVRRLQQQHQFSSSSFSSSSSPSSPFPRQKQQQQLTTTTTTTTNIEGFELSSLGPANTSAQPRPVVVLIGWLNAKPRHLLKYQELYWQRGFDVLTMKVSPIHIVRPKAGIKYTAKLLNVLQENQELSGRQVVVHGFSIGAFIYTQLQLLMQRQQEQQQQLQQQQLQQQQQQQQQRHRYYRGWEQAETTTMMTTLFPGSLARLFHQDTTHHHPQPPSSTSSPPPRDLNTRIAGLVLDSPAYIDHMCQGIANAVTANVVGRAAISGSLQLYLAAFPRSVTFHYHESHRAFHANAVPALILHSDADSVSSATVSDRYLAEWRQKGVPAFSRKFPGSTHVAHFRTHPQEYEAALGEFLAGLKLQEAPVEAQAEASASSPKVVELQEVEEESSGVAGAASVASASVAASVADAASAVADAAEVQRLQAKVP